jgi:hypothetical protein
MSALAMPVPAQPQAEHPPEEVTPSEPGFPVLVAKEPVAANEAPLRDDDVVLGVVIDEEPRAYPVGQFRARDHHALNDTLGGAELTATW